MARSVKLTVKWQLDAAMLSRPVDLTALVTMSRSEPDSFLEDNSLHRLISLLNETNEKKSDRDTKLDVLNILANIANGSQKANTEVRVALQGVSEWFEDYMAKEESSTGQEPELNKGMVLLLARCWEYKIKTEDVLELTKGNRKIALCTVVGLLEDGETYSTELRQRQRPGQGKMGQWEHELVCHRYEKPLLLQICRLLQGFTHPGTYFDSSKDLALYSIERFSSEMDTLLEITLRSRLVEKLSMALFDCLFENPEEDTESEAKGDRSFVGLEEYEHIAVSAVHGFLQNLYFYAAHNTEELRRHLLMETLLLPRFVLPYLDRCVIHATILNTRAEAFSNVLDDVAEMALHNPNLIKGMSASLRTLIVASFRAPSTQFVVTLLRRLNPTSQLLRASAFCRYHDYIFALICMLNVNMGSLDLAKQHEDDDEGDEYAGSLFHQLASIFHSMSGLKQANVAKRLMFSGALPIARDTVSFASILSIVHGGAAGQLIYIANGTSGNLAKTRDAAVDYEQFEFMNSRAEAKKAHMERMNHLRSNVERVRDHWPERSLDDNRTAFQIAVSVANAAEEKDEKIELQSHEDLRTNKFRLLGDLPELGSNRAYRRDILDTDNEVALSLEVPRQSENKSGALVFKSENKLHDREGGDDLSIPKEFLCAINGHVMKDPVRVLDTGLVFERSTIELWIATRGAVCPITNTHLDKHDLEPSHDLRNRIKRYQIEQLAMRKTGPDDDLYDF